MVMEKKSLFRTVFEREVKRITRDPVYLFFMIIGPLIAFSLITLIFSSNIPSKLSVGIVDLDHSNLSRRITRMVDATSIVAVDRSYINLNEAYLSMVSGNINAIICIPERTEQNILCGKSTKIAVYINNEYLIKGGLLSSGIQKAMGTLSAGIRMKAQLMHGSTERQALAEIMPVQLRPVLLFNPYTSYSYYLTILMVPVMLTVFILFGTLYALGAELQYRTCPEWMDATNGKIIATLPMGDRCDGIIYSSKDHNAISSNGEGTLTVVHQDGPDAYKVIQTVPTKKSAKTIAYDETTGKIYLSCADVTVENGKKIIAPGSFKILVVSK